MEEFLRWDRYSPYTLAGKTWIMTEHGLQDPEEAGPVSQLIYSPKESRSVKYLKPILISMMDVLW
jgi:hypothetical protein